MDGGENVNAVLFFMILVAVGYAAAWGRLEAVSQAAMTAGGDAVKTAVSLLGGFLLFGGLMSILERAGAVRALVRALNRPLRRLFGKEVTEEALEAIALNLSANMLGLGNAATPMGLRAARLLNRMGSEIAPPALCLLLVINTTSVQIMPTTVIALRYAAGSARPEAVVLPGLAASAASTVVGILLSKALERKRV